MQAIHLSNLSIHLVKFTKKINITYMIFILNFIFTVIFYVMR
jgi:hypothetical protein